MDVAVGQGVDCGFVRAKTLGGSGGYRLSWFLGVKTEKERLASIDLLCPREDREKGGIRPKSHRRLKRKVTES